MKRIFPVLFLIVIVAALVGLNAISYTRTDEKPDTELEANRSSYNAGTTGTSAYYDLLSETGNKVTRWQQPPSALLSSSNSNISTLVLIGEPLRPLTEDDAEKILTWVREGGRLVLIDRFPPLELLKVQSNWDIASIASAEDNSYLDQKESSYLIEKIVAAKPSQPTALTKNISAVQPSRLASRIQIKYKDAEVKAAPLSGYGYYEGPVGRAPATPTPTPMTPRTPVASPTPETLSEAPPPAMAGSGEYDNVFAAPIIHLSNPGTDLLVEIPHGSGQILFLSDPYIVSNAGIDLVDNAILGINLAATTNGTIAFDEYHQGFGSENSLLRYFSGTPVLAIFGQALLLVFFVLWTQGKRFGRPLPLPVKDRRSKLEYVGAMADLQQSTRSYDLAIENVYSQIKRDMVRVIGADNTIGKKELAEAISERSGFEAKDLYVLMTKCEDIIHGEPTNAKETMNLISQLRALEAKLGLNRAKTARLK